MKMFRMTIKYRPGMIDVMYAESDNLDQMNRLGDKMNYCEDNGIYFEVTQI